MTRLVFSFLQSGLWGEAPVRGCDGPLDRSRQGTCSWQGLPLPGRLEWVELSPPGSVPQVTAYLPSPHSSSKLDPGGSPDPPPVPPPSIKMCQAPALALSRTSSISLGERKGGSVKKQQCILVEGQFKVNVGMSQRWFGKGVCPHEVLRRQCGAIDCFRARSWHDRICIFKN